MNITQIGEEIEIKADSRILILIENAFVSILTLEDLNHPSMNLFSGQLTKGGGLGDRGGRRNASGVDLALTGPKKEKKLREIEQQKADLNSELGKMLEVEKLDLGGQQPSPFSEVSNLWSKNDLLIMKIASVRKGQRLLGRCLFQLLPLYSFSILMCLFRNVVVTLKCSQESQDTILIQCMNQFIMKRANLPLITRSMEAFLVPHPKTGEIPVQAINSFPFFQNGSCFNFIDVFIKRVESLRKEPQEPIYWEKYEQMLEKIRELSDEGRK